MKPFKILYLTQFPEIGGGETILLSLLEKINHKLFEPIVIVPKRGQLSDRLKKLNVQTHYLKLPPYLIRTFFVPGASPTALWQLATLSGKIKPDLIHTNHLTLAIYGALVGKILRIPVVATAHGPWDSYYFYQDLINQFALNKILANTPQTAQSLTKRGIIKRQKVEVVPFGIDTQKFKPATRHQKLTTRKIFGFSPDDFVVTIVGRLDPIKDHLTFLKAANIVSHQLPSVKFLIVGSTLGDFSGRKNDYWAQIKNYLGTSPSLAKNVAFGGFIEAMAPIYGASDILVSTSHSESFGLSIAEAAACQIPTIATTKDKKHPLILDDKTGFTTPVQNPQILAQKILRLARDWRLRNNFGQAARKYICQNYPIESYVSRIQSTYHKHLRSSSFEKRQKAPAVNFETTAPL